MSDDPRGNATAVLWAAVLAEFDKYGGFQPTEIAEWSQDSRNKAPAQLKAGTLADWKRTRRTAPERRQFETLLTYLEHLRSRAARAGGEVKRAPEQIRDFWWGLWAPAYEERKERGRRSAKEPPAEEQAGEGSQRPPVQEEEGDEPPGRERHQEPRRASVRRVTQRGGRRKPSRWIAAGVAAIGVLIGGAVYSDSREIKHRSQPQAAELTEKAPPGSAVSRSTRPNQTIGNQTTLSALRCAYVKKMPAFVYPAPDTSTKEIKYKRLTDRVVVLDLGYPPPPPGWIAVSTPHNPPGYNWMQMSVLTSPSRAQCKMRLPGQN
jgi:hypothetical protein